MSLTCQVFDGLDGDGNGEIAYSELRQVLGRGRNGAQLSAPLQAGAMGEIETNAKNRCALRRGNTRSVEPYKCSTVVHSRAEGTASAI